MNNILTDALPHSVDIGGRKYAINTDFRTCLRVILAFEDDSLTAYEKQIIMLTNLYPTLPDDARLAMEQANLFLNGGRVSADIGIAPRLYSFGKDANLIFAAFHQTHGIDLQTADLHWWKFLALFMDLGTDTAFCNLVSLRQRVKSGRATKEEQRVAREMGETFDVPELDDRTLEEREIEAAFFAAIGQSPRIATEQGKHANTD